MFSHAVVWGEWLTTGCGAVACKIHSDAFPGVSMPTHFTDQWEVTERRAEETCTQSARRSSSTASAPLSYAYRGESFGGTEGEDGAPRFPKSPLHAPGLSYSGGTAEDRSWFPTWAVFGDCPVDHLLTPPGEHRVQPCYPPTLCASSQVSDQVRHLPGLCAVHPTHSAPTPSSKHDCSKSPG